MSFRSKASALLLVSAALAAAAAGASQLGKILDGPIYMGTGLGFSREPGYSGALKSTLGSNDHSWSLYLHMKTHYRDWDLVANASGSLLFSKMYDMEFSALRRSRVEAFDPRIDSRQFAALLNHPHLTVQVDRIGTITAITPTPSPIDTADKTAIIVVHGGNHMVITPISLLAHPPIAAASP